MLTRSPFKWRLKSPNSSFLIRSLTTEPSSSIRRVPSELKGRCIQSYTRRAQKALLNMNPLFLQTPSPNPLPKHTYSCTPNSHTSIRLLLLHPSPEPTSPLQCTPSMRRRAKDSSMANSKFLYIRAVQHGFLSLPAVVERTTESHLVPSDIPDRNISISSYSNYCRWFLAR